MRLDYPNDPGAQEWVDGRKDLDHRARDWVRDHPQASDAEREAAQHRFAAEAHRLSAPHIGKPVPQRVLCERDPEGAPKFLPELFVFVADPRVPATNNAAERALRPTVISRKISGGTRSDAGSHTKAVLATVLGTWLARGQNPYTACLAALTSQEI